MELGTIELNRNVQNYFADVEQAAFTPANVVPGIGFSPDRLLQDRFFSYGDTQRYRLDINYHQIPVNVPRAPIANTFHSHGAMRTDSNLGGRVNYEPNRYGEFAQDANASEPPLAASMVHRFNHREDDDYYSQPATFFPCSMMRSANVCSAMSRGISSACRRISLRVRWNTSAVSIRLTRRASSMRLRSSARRSMRKIPKRSDLD